MVTGDSAAHTALAEPAPVRAGVEAPPSLVARSKGAPRAPASTS